MPRPKSKTPPYRGKRNRKGEYLNSGQHGEELRAFYKAEYERLKAMTPEEFEALATEVLELRAPRPETLAFFAEQFPGRDVHRSHLARAEQNHENIHAVALELGKRGPLREIRQAEAANARAKLAEKVALRQAAHKAERDARHAERELVRKAQKRARLEAKKRGKIPD